MKSKNPSSMFDKKQSSFRLRSELNDLKRTAKSCAKEVNCSVTEIENYLNGEYDVKSYLHFLLKFCEYYSVNISDLIVYKKDTKKGILYFDVEDSIKSKRIFKRKNKNNQLTEYYEYRDTARSNVSNFYPEWISQIRYVKNSDPHNPDVRYNNGHLLHQLNLFVGPVNYYYEIKGKKICKEMNTGDTSYISPYVKHSFTSRDKNKLAFIIAVTTGSSFKRNQNKLRMFGKLFFEKLIRKKYSDFQFFQDTIKRALNNEMLNDREFKKNINISLYKKINSKTQFKKINISEIFKISEVLGISPSDFFYNIKSEKKVINKFFNKNEFDYFPSQNDIHYKIYKSARSKNFSNLKGFIIEVISGKKKKLNFKFTLNIYLINFGTNNVNINWKYKSKIYTKKIKSGDSIFIEPFINFNLSTECQSGLIFLVTSESGIDLNTQKEISSISKINRMIEDNEQWFEGS